MNKYDSIGIIVTYNPNEETLEVINCLIKQPIFLVVVDNGSKKNDLIENFDKEFGQSDRISLIRKENNVGLASAQNEGIKFAIEKKFKFLFFFDQDTIIPEHYINDMRKSYEYYESTYDKQLGILAPNYLDKNIKDFAHFAKLTKNSYLDVSLGNKEYINVSFVISSGSMIKVDTLKKIGFLRDDFFIDQIDTEYSLRLLTNNFEVVATSNATLLHTIGNRERKKLFFLTIKPNHHNSIRKYYIFRNGQYLIKKYGNKLPGFKKLMRHRFIHDLIGVIFYEERKISKIKSIIIGYNEGNKMFNSEIKEQNY